MRGGGEWEGQNREGQKSRSGGWGGKRWGAEEGGPEGGEPEEGGVEGREWGMGRGFSQARTYQQGNNTTMLSTQTGIHLLFTSMDIHAVRAQ